jgi:hypothetical protein
MYKKKTLKSKRLDFNSTSKAKLSLRVSPELSEGSVGDEIQAAKSEYFD